MVRILINRVDCCRFFRCGAICSSVFYKTGKYDSLQCVTMPWQHMASYKGRLSLAIRILKKGSGAATLLLQWTSFIFRLRIFITGWLQWWRVQLRWKGSVGKSIALVCMGVENSSPNRNGVPTGLKVSFSHKACFMWSRNLDWWRYALSTLFVSVPQLSTVL